MSPGLATRYAARSVRRNLRRTALSVAGIAVGVALTLFVEGIIRGEGEMYVRTAAESGIGHLRVVPAGWAARRDPDLRLAGADAAMRAARALPGLAGAAPRAHAQVLLAMGTHTVPVEMTGVDAALEPAVDRLVRRPAAGRYLTAGERGAVVVGRAIAERLGVELDDELLVTTMGRDGGIESRMLRVVGVIATGSEEIDAGIAHVALDDLTTLTGRPGAAEVTLLLRDWRTAPAARTTLAAALAGGDSVLTWEELSPEFAGHLRQDAATSRLITLLVIVVVLLGVTSAQLAAVLERRREFAVLSALGMGGWRMATLVLQEALVLGLAGAALGGAIGAPLVWHYARQGLDFTRWMGRSYAFEGVLVQPVIHLDFGWWIVPVALLVALGATLVASLVPARYAARTDPAVALRVAP